MSGRKSFIIHKDSLSVLDDLTDEQAGKLFKAIKAYQEGEMLDVDCRVHVAVMLGPAAGAGPRPHHQWQGVEPVATT